MKGKLAHRTLTAAVFLSFFFLSFHVRGLEWLFAVLVGLFGVMCVIELGRLLCALRFRFPFALCLAAVLLLLYDGFASRLSHAVPILAGTLIVLLSDRVRRSDLERMACEVSTAFLAVVYVGLPTGMAAALSQMHDPVSQQAVGEGLLLFVMGIAFCGDTAAYLVGSRWGKTPFFPTISPKKTFEGFVAGLIVSFLLAVLALAVLPTLRGFLGWGHGLILGAVLSVMVPLGDLAESLFKREAGWKNSGGELTGHGGFLDMFDSLLFCLPVQFCYVQYLVVPFRTLLD
ncbi:MAG: phosphatidate cytidylyltransferase [Candidatus Sumerlaeia bacterium]|nr:phosphatidate cytidylyltransferase [Candidatus Sumerlaeia bacterium]